MLSKTDIHLITSDFNEGWGVVTNEAMSAGCCVISSKQTGAAPYLIKDGYNGLLFDVNKQEELNACLINAISNKKLRDRLGQKAIETMNNVWSPQNAANQLVNLINHLVNGEKHEWQQEVTDGPCSAIKSRK